MPQSALQLNSKRGSVESQTRSGQTTFQWTAGKMIIRRFIGRTEQMTKHATNKWLSAKEISRQTARGADWKYHQIVTLAQVSLLSAIIIHILSS
jgi:hypothetical protein